MSEIDRSKDPVGLNTLSSQGVTQAESSPTVKKTTSIGLNKIRSFVNAHPIASLIIGFVTLPLSAPIAIALLSTKYASQKNKNQTSVQETTLQSSEKKTNNSLSKENSFSAGVNSNYYSKGSAESFSLPIQKSYENRGVFTELKEVTVQSGNYGKTHYATSKGNTLNYNEDRVISKEISLNGQSIDVIGIADGHGGEGAADCVQMEFASLFEETFLEQGHKEITKTTIETTAKSVIEKLDAKIREDNQNLIKTNGKESGTTLSVNLLAPQSDGSKMCFTICVGDSPSCIYREGGEVEIIEGQRIEEGLSEEVQHDLNTWTLIELRKKTVYDACTPKSNISKTTSKSNISKTDVIKTLNQQGFCDKQGNPMGATSATIETLLNEAKEENPDFSFILESLNKELRQTHPNHANVKMYHSTLRGADCYEYTYQTDNNLVNASLTENNGVNASLTDNNGVNASLLPEASGFALPSGIRVNGIASYDLGISGADTLQVKETKLNVGDRLIIASDSLSDYIEFKTLDKILEKKTQEIKGTTQNIDDETLPEGITRYQFNDEEGFSLSFCEDQEGNRFNYLPLSMPAYKRDGKTIVIKNPNHLKHLLLSENRSDEISTQILKETLKEVAKDPTQTTNLVKTLVSHSMQGDNTTLIVY